MMTPSASATEIAATHVFGRVVVRREFCRISICFDSLLSVACVIDHRMTARGWRHQENYGVRYWLFGIYTGLGFGA